MNARVSGSEGANFWYSTDGGATTTPMLTVDNTAFGAGQTFPLPGGTNGPVLIGVSDASQSNGEGVDSVYVDYLVITSYTELVDPPVAPSGLTIDGSTANSVSLSFLDNADDEWGFEVWRGSSSMSSCAGATSVATLGGSESANGTVSYMDSGLAAETTYRYWVSAFNSSDSACSAYADATTDVHYLALTVLATKTRGVHTPTLRWLPADQPVDVFFNSNPLTGGANVTGGEFIHNTGNKKGGPYVYKVCLQGTANCTAEVTVSY